MTIFEIATILIALCALAISIQQGCASRKQSKENAKDAARTREHEKTLFEETQRQNRLSCRPHLTPNNHTNTNDEGVTVTYTVSNYGLGPARIVKVELFLDGAPFEFGEDPIEEITMAVFGKTPGFEVPQQAWMSADYVFPEKANYRYGTLVFKGMNKEQLPAMKQAFERMDIRIEYESFYEERFVFDSREKSKAPLES
jgi:hypothetical protein